MGAGSECFWTSLDRALSYNCHFFRQSFPDGLAKANRVDGGFAVCVEFDF